MNLCVCECVRAYCVCVRVYAFECVRAYCVCVRVYAFECVCVYVCVWSVCVCERESEREVEISPAWWLQQQLRRNSAAGYRRAKEPTWKVNLS